MTINLKNYSRKMVPEVLYNQLVLIDVIGQIVRRTTQSNNKAHSVPQVIKVLKDM